MKKTIKKLIPLLLCTLTLISSLTSCAKADENDTQSTDKPSVEQGTEQTQKPVNTPSTSKPSNTSKPSDTEKNESSGTQNDITIDSYKEQISYYMALTESLQAELLELKEEAYIDECEYQLKVSTLEDTIEMLKKTIASLSENKTPSVNTQAPSNDQLSAKPDYKYTIENGKVTITEYVGKDIDVSIPPTIDGLPVVKIGEEAFKAMQIRSVTVPSGVKEIDWFAFSACTVLECIYIPSSVTLVGYGAFDYCPKSLTVKCEKGSYIEAYAHSWGMKVEAK